MKEGGVTNNYTFVTYFIDKSLFKGYYLSKPDGRAFHAKATGLQGSTFMAVNTDGYVLPTDEPALMGTTFLGKTTECTLTATTVTKEGNQEKTENVNSTIEVTYDGSAKLGTEIKWDYEVANGTEITDVEVFCPHLKLQSHSDFLGSMGFFIVQGPNYKTYDYVYTAGVSGNGLTIAVGLAAAAVAALAFFM